MSSTPIGEQIKWLKTRQEDLLSELTLGIEELHDTRQKNIAENLLEYVRISQEIQNMGFLSVLTYLKEMQSEIDDELMEISEYMAAILSIHRTEAENLEKFI
jgi:hypothetical protein